MTDTVRHVTEAEYAEAVKHLDRARDLREADTSKMALAEKVEHQRSIKAAMDRARGK